VNWIQLAEHNPVGDLGENGNEPSGSKKQGIS
jgi:hypothetical protein